MHKDQASLLERMETFVNSLQDFFWEVDEQGRYTYVSPQVEAILGYPPEEVIGKTPFELMPEDEAVSVGRVFEEHARRRESFSLLKNLNRHKDGSPVLLETNGTPFFDTDGSLLGYRGSDRVIDGRAYPEVLDCLGDGVVVMATDADQKIIYASNAIENILGYRADEVIGLPGTVFDFPENQTKDSVEWNLQRLGKGNDVRGIRLRRAKNGSAVPVYINARPIRDASGNICRYVGSFTDVSDLIEARKELKANEEELSQARLNYQNLVESIPGVVWTMNSDGDTQYISPNVTDIFGFTPEEVYESGQDLWLDRIHDDDKKDVVSAFSELFETGHPLDIEYRILKKDGHWIWLRDRAVIPPGESSAIGVFFEISEQKQDQLALRDSESRLNKIFSTTPEGLVITDLATGRILQVNRAFTNLFGYSEKEVLGRTTVEMFWGSPTDREKLVEQIKANNVVRNFESLFRRKDGTIFPGSCSSSILELGEQHALCSLIRDVSDLKQAESEKIMAVEKHKESLSETIIAIGSALEKRDPYTAGHQKNVASLAANIAQKLGLNQELVKGIELGATIHDIGKIYIPSEILNRPGGLSETEFEIIKSHPIVGSEIISNVNFPWPIADMLLQHHERLDGTGYPKGLAGDEILLEARIIAVADVFDAVCSHRPHRPALGCEIATSILNEGAGILFDREAVNACLSV
ncbi:MAG: PAS domain S-box protein, partial [Gammaproteobacteria bacterium]|nr:PAS domain S-box protein [Gammaproteobacteria bacterium]